MSEHDNGTFGKLLMALEQRGFRGVSFRCNFGVGERWTCWAYDVNHGGEQLLETGLTGEQALRYLVERVTRNET